MRLWYEKCGRCPKCDAEYTGSYNIHCSECGTELVIGTRWPICPCNTEVRSNQKHCSNCGRSSDAATIRLNEFFLPKKLLSLYRFFIYDDRK